MPNYGHLSLSCAKIERPSPLEKPSCKVRFSPKPIPTNIAKVTATTLFQTVSHPDFQLLAQTPHVCFHSRKWVHPRLHPKDRTQPTRRNTGRFGWGGITTLGRSARSQTSPGRVSEQQTLPLWGLVKGAPQRTQRAFGTAMRLCVSLFRKSAAPPGCVIFRFCRNRDLYIRRSWFSAWARQGRYHYPRCAPRAAETLGGRLSKRLICRFLRSGGRSSPHDSYFLANTQNFLLAVPVANAFALWYDKFSKLEFAKEVEHMKKSLVFAVIFILLFTVGCSQQKNEQPSLTETTSPPEALASQQTIIPEFEDVSWPVVSVRAEDFGMEATLDNPVFAEVFDNTSEMPLDKLIAFDLIADALSEGASDEIYRRFMEAPNAVLTFLSLVGDQTVELTGLGKYLLQSLHVEALRQRM